jgi:hypothetical protein
VSPGMERILVVVRLFLAAGAIAGVAWMLFFV